MNPTPDYVAAQPAPAAATAQPPAAAPAMRPPMPGEQLSGWTPPPPPGWAPPPGYPRLPLPVAPSGQPLASFGDRFLACLLDYAVHFVFSLVTTIPLYLWWLFSFLDTMERMTDSPYDPDSAGPDPSEFFAEVFLPLIGLMAALLVLNLLFTYLYFVEFQLKRGQTVGKRVMKLKITPLDPAAPLTRLDLVKRWSVAYVVGIVVPFFSYLDGLWQLWDKPFQQCLHDKAAKTVVVKVG